VPFIELAAAALVAQAAAAPPATVARGQPPIHVEAPEVSWDVAGGEALLRGGVLLRRGATTLRAPEARYRPSSGEVEVRGDALLVEGRRAIVAKGFHGVVGGRYEAEAPALFLVEDAASLARATTAAEAERAVRYLTLRADRATSEPDGTLRLSNARGTTCSAPDGEAPTWELRARRADVRAGDRAVLSWPVLWVTPRFLFVERPVPVLALPWLYLPLGERQSGLLLPELRSSAATGLTLVEPLFVTLGRSADATAWAGWSFGPSRARFRAGDPSVRGFVGALELRWAPAARAAGRLRLDWTQDLDAEPGGARGGRVALSGSHAQSLGAVAELRLDLDLVGDPLYGRDFTGDVLARDATYRRSAVLYSRRAGDAVAEASATWLLPLARDRSLADVPGLSYGLFGADLPTFHRGPSVAASLLPTALGAGLLASGRVELTRFGPIAGPTNDAGSDGLGPGDLGWSEPLATLPDPGQLDGQWRPGERLATTRALARVELSRPFAVGRLLRVSPFLRGAVAGYAFDAAVDPLADAWGAAGARIETELSRRYGAVKHSIVPRLEWRLGSGVAGGALPAFAYDGWDRAAEVPPGATALGASARRLLSAAPPGPFQQARASIETRLDGPAGSLLRLELGQDLDLRAGTLAESFATLRASVGPVGAEGVLRYAGFASRPGDASALDDWTEVKGDLRLRSARGWDVHASLRSVGAGGAAATQGGVDALFDLRPMPLPLSSQASVGFRVPLGPATFGYDVLFPGRDVTVSACDASGDPAATRRLGALHVQQQTASFVWDSPCRCFRLALKVRLSDCDGFDPRSAGVGLALDLSPREPLGSTR